jgi:leucyl-tRNA synthetase
MVLASDGQKMSKSRGNVINPDDVVAEFGADSLRLYEMFMGPFNQAISWDPHGILGMERFLKKIWDSFTSNEQLSHFEMNRVLERKTHQAIKKVSDDIEGMKFNTAISHLMSFLPELEKLNPADAKDKEIVKFARHTFLKLIAPFAPHIAEELWDGKKSIHISPWPVYDVKLIVEDSFELIIQINGKVRDKVAAPMNISQADAAALASGREETKKWLTATPKKIIFVSNRLINFIV